MARRAFARLRIMLDSRGSDRDRQCFVEAVRRVSCRHHRESSFQEQRLDHANTRLYADERSRSGLTAQIVPA
jgi:hypothetical protein